MFRAKSIAIGRAVAIVTVGLLGLLLSTSIALAQSVPKAICGPEDHTESGLQGQTTVDERSSGDSERAYNCNLELVGEYRGEGAYSQDGPAYDGDCAYYGTDKLRSSETRKWADHASAGATGPSLHTNRVPRSVARQPTRSRPPQRQDAPILTGDS